MSGKMVVQTELAGARVVAGGRVMKGVRSRTFELKDINGTCHTKPENLQVDCVRGYLEINSKVPIPSWFKCINLAVDVHTANVHLSLTTQKTDHFLFHLEVIRNIEIGQELFVWFSEEMCMIVNMPFLTPRNIIGHKKYKCHDCGENFEHPNPLKIHLLLSCGKESKYSPWNHISRVIGEKFLLTERPPLRSTTEAPTSAFLPYRKQLVVDPSPAAAQPLNLTVGPHVGGFETVWTNRYADSKIAMAAEEVNSNYAADVELFASNWGKLKHGHLCVYCGKVYSRKYGLKIHIRTHTGYKPLKCKYCLRPFGDPSNLNKHVRLHASSLSQYMCSLCGKVLVRRRDLERHLRSQHGGEDTDSVQESQSD